MEGLRTRSKYVIAMQADPDKVGGGSEASKFLKFKNGDLIMLDEPAGQNLLTSSWASGIFFFFFLKQHNKAIKY